MREVRRHEGVEEDVDVEAAPAHRSRHEVAQLGRVEDREELLQARERGRAGFIIGMVIEIEDQVRATAMVDCEGVRPGVAHAEKVRLERELAADPVSRGPELKVAKVFEAAYLRDRAASEQLDEDREESRVDRAPALARARDALRELFRGR